MTARLAVCAFVVALLVTAACRSDAPESATSPATPFTYVSDVHHFSLRYDRRFEDIHYYQTPYSGFRVGFFDKDGATPGVTPDGLWITLIDKRPDAGRDDAERKRHLKKLVADLEAESPGGKPQWRETTVGGLPAAWSEDVSPVDGYRRISFLVVGSRNVYLMVGAAVGRTWAECRPLFVAAFESFREI